MARYLAFVFVLCMALGLALACGDGGGPSGTSTPQPTATGTSEPPTTPAPTTTPSESGSDPIFWRTEDNFSSLQAGKAYKVLFRITNGYAEPALTVTATCQSCAQPSGRQPVNFVGQRAEPVGNEAPGSYYPMNIELPFAGRWEIAVVAGSDTARIPVEVHAVGEPG